MGLAPGTWTPPLAPMEAKHGVSEAKAAGTVEGLMGTKAQWLLRLRTRSLREVFR
jgi:hypothetical protein